MPAKTTTTNEAMISPRSRNLGYGWTSAVERVYNADYSHSTLQVQAPGGPRVQGGLRSVLAERERAQKVNSSSDWVERLYVGGREVTGYWGIYLRDCGTCAACTNDNGDGYCWHPISKETWLRPAVGALLEMLSCGTELRVRLTDEKGA